MLVCNDGTWSKFDEPALEGPTEDVRFSGPGVDAMG
jgi:hypothetical protein